MEKKKKTVPSVIVFFIALLCIFYISNRKPKFDKNKWDKVSHRFEMSDDLIQIYQLNSMVMEIIFYQRYIPLNFNEALVFNIKNRQKYIDVRNSVHYTDDRGVICMR